MEQKEIPAPRPAATVLLLRDAPGGMEVFMVVRHHGMAFAGGSRVFPGGRVDDDDMTLSAAESGASIPGIPPASMAFRVAGIRETFEESGILLARPRGQAGLIPGERLARLEPARQRMHKGELKFSDMLAAEKLVPATDLLVPFAHWITPIILPKRYDTQFFLAAAPVDQAAIHDGGESVDSLWISPAAAVTDADNDRGKLEFATRMNVLKLGRSRNVDEAMAAARSSAIIPVQPVIAHEGEGLRAKIPLTADYGGDDFPVVL